MEQIDHVIIDYDRGVIYAVSNFGRQVEIQFPDNNKLMQGIQKCGNWIPAERILRF